MEHRGYKKITHTKATVCSSCCSRISAAVTPGYRGATFLSSSSTLRHEKLIIIYLWACIVFGFRVFCFFNVTTSRHCPLICPSLCPAEALSVRWPQSGLRAGGWKEDAGATKHQDGVEGRTAVENINGYYSMWCKKDKHTVAPAWRTSIKRTKNYFKKHFEKQ